MLGYQSRSMRNSPDISTLLSLMLRNGLVAKEAGMGYIVITAKHHDGFCMFHTEFTDYNIVDATPFNRDPYKYTSKPGKLYVHVLAWP